MLYRQVKGSPVQPLDQPQTLPLPLLPAAQHAATATHGCLPPSCCYPVTCRFLVRADYTAAEAIAAEVPEHIRPWNREDFDAFRRESSRNLLLAAERINPLTAAHDLLGIMAMELRPSRILLQYLAVRPDVRRQGIGRQLILRAKGSLSGDRRTAIKALVPERSLQVQQFLRSQGFLCVETVTLKDGWDSDYRFAYTVMSEPECNGI